ncbi:DapH/DapD/GlmU-related protein [Pararhodobacter zhoushanensis]|uniref:DapH/DapD/GlmU-related protein n=1 Tax=Pararhodobacter zhoushanensis TaxID=2479545 RepID=UPI001C6FE31A|nr:acetyltransferase [Pararhodobacter zhoushanensis]
MTSQPTRLYVDSRSHSDKARRALWHVTRSLLFAPLRGPLFKRWRLFLLRSFGATIGKGCRVDASCKIWWPGNLRMGNYACLADAVDCYNVAPITLGDYATVSQRSFLCSASHATDQLSRPLIFAPITLETHAWVGAEAFVGPGVTIGEGAVLGARAVATRNLESWTIYAGIPARALRKREIRE